MARPGAVGTLPPTLPFASGVRELVEANLKFAGVTLREVNLNHSKLLPESTVSGGTAGLPVYGTRVIFELRKLEASDKSRHPIDRLRQDCLPLDDKTKIKAMNELHPSIIIVLMEPSTGVILEARSFPSNAERQQLIYMVNDVFEIAVPSAYWTDEPPDDPAVGTTEMGDKYAASVLAMLVAIIIRSPNKLHSNTGDDNTVVYGRFHHAKLGFCVRVRRSRPNPDEAARPRTRCA
jgi:hypothetical protein